MGKRGRSASMSRSRSPSPKAKVSKKKHTSGKKAKESTKKRAKKDEGKIDLWKREKELELMAKHNVSSLKYVASGEEAGAGCWMGSCAIASCVVPEGVIIPGLNDSKKLSETKRQELYEIITNHKDIVWSCVLVDNKEIDATGNILKTRMQGMAKAIRQVQDKIRERDGPDAKVELAIIDGNKKPPGLDHEMSVETVVGGDGICACVAAASVIAKETRDRLCRGDWHLQYPDFLFSQNKGYGTAFHKEMLDKHGPTSLHRMSFRPMCNFKSS